MLIVCPSCASEYTISTDRIGPTGRVVRCASCREAWFIAPEEPLQDTDGATSETAGGRPRPRPPAKRKNRGGAGGSKAPAALALGLLAIMVLAVLLRTTVVRIVPESAAAFAMVGLPVNLVGLQLAGIKSDIGQEGDVQVLVVTGEIANETGRPVRVPPVAFTIEGENGATLYSWTDKNAGSELAAHAVMRFQARLASPPPDGKRVLVTFSMKPSSATVASR